MFQLAYVFACILVLAGIGVVVYAYNEVLFIEEYIIPVISAFGVAVYLAITATLQANTAVKVGFGLTAVASIVLISWIVKVYLSNRTEDLPPYATGCKYKFWAKKGNGC